MRVLAFIVLVVSAFAGQAPAAADQALIRELQRGGYTLYFRHAPTDWSQRDRVRTLTDCASCDPRRMRQLSEEGRQLARRVGAAIRRLGIPVDAVLASEYCRTVETARLLGLGQVSTTRDVINTRVADLVGGRDALAQRARARLAMRPIAGSNTVIVAHGNLFMLVAGSRPVELGAAIVRGDGRGGFSMVGQLAPEDWSKLSITRLEPDVDTRP